MLLRVIAVHGSSAAAQGSLLSLPRSCAGDRPVCGGWLGQAGADTAAARSVDLIPDNYRLLCLDLFMLGVFSPGETQKRQEEAVAGSKECLL